jgi:hypothetical protein
MARYPSALAEQRLARIVTSIAKACALHLHIHHSLTITPTSTRDGPLDLVSIELKNGIALEVEERRDPEWNLRK